MNKNWPRRTLREETYSTLDDLRTRTKLVRITNAGLIKSRPQDVKEAPNYQEGRGNELRGIGIE